jgi:hypothetical protein
MKKPIIQIIKDVCFHEAGHYVIGKRLGFQVLGVNIRIEDLFGAYSGGCTIKLLRWTPKSGPEDKLSGGIGDRLSIQ